jgi:hypothetical protein
MQLKATLAGGRNGSSFSTKGVISIEIYITRAVVTLKNGIVRQNCEDIYSMRG